MKTAIEYKEEYLQILTPLSDIEFIRTFNGQVGISAFGVARQGHLSAIRSELTRRSIDFSNIGDENIMSYKYVVYLKGKKLYRLSDLPKDDVRKVFDSYMREMFPVKMKFRPKLIEYSNDEIKFGMRKHMGVLSFKSNDLVKKSSTPEIFGPLTDVREISIRVTHHYLVIDGMKFFDQLKSKALEFIRGYNLYSFDSLIYVCDMGGHLIEKLYRDLIDSGFEQDQDFIIGTESYFRGVDKYEDWSVKYRYLDFEADWLVGVASDKGTYIWRSDF